MKSFIIGSLIILISIGSAGAEPSGSWDKCLEVTMVKTKKLTSGLVGYVINEDEPQIMLAYYKSKFYEFDSRKNKKLSADELSSKAKELPTSVVSESVSYAIIDLVSAAKKQKISSVVLQDQLEKKLQPCIDTGDKVVGNLVRKELDEAFPRLKSSGSKKSVEGVR